MAFAFKTPKKQDAQQASRDKNNQKPSTITIRADEKAEKQGTLMCAACKISDDTVKLVDGDVANSLKCSKDSAFTGFNKIAMHDECRDGIVKNVPPKVETPRNKYNFVQCGGVNVALSPDEMAHLS